MQSMSIRQIKRVSYPEHHFLDFFKQINFNMKLTVKYQKERGVFKQNQTQKINQSSKSFIREFKRRAHLRQRGIIRNAFTVLTLEMH